MKILVCVKQVPDADSSLSIDESARYVRTDSISFRINRYDEYAVEEALRLREAFPGTDVDALTVGPARAAGAVKRAMEMGADSGVHIMLGGDLFHETQLVASLVHAYARGAGYDLILCGVMAEDDMRSQLGPMLASLLDLPFASSVMRVSLLRDGESVQVEREVEGGVREAFEIALPALLCVQSGINRPRYPSLSNVLRARGQKPLVLDAASLVGELPAAAEYSLRLPERTQGGEILGGAPRDKARALIEILRGRGLLQEKS